MDFIFDNLVQVIPFVLVVIWILRMMRSVSRRRRAMVQKRADSMEPANAVSPASPIEEKSVLPPQKDEPVPTSAVYKKQEENKLSTMPSEAVGSVLRSSLRAREYAPIVKTHPLRKLERYTPLAQGMLWNVILSPPPSLTPPEEDAHI